MMVRCLPQRATVFSFPLTRRSSQFLPPPTRSFRTNRGIKSDSNRLPFTSSIPPPPFPLFPSSRFSRSHWFFSPPTRFTMNDRETCVRRLRPILFPLLKFCLLFAQPRSLSLSIFERIFLDSFGLSLVYSRWKCLAKIKMFNLIDILYLHVFGNVLIRSNFSYEFY